MKKRIDTPYPPDLCLQDLIESQAARTPDAVAVVAEGGRLTFHELSERADRLARHLRGLGAGPEVPVGLCLERSLEMVVGLAGVLKAGGAYVPLDPAYPRQRLAFMLEDARVPVLLTAGDSAVDLPLPSGTRVVRLDEEPPPGDCALYPPDADQSAYIIYTSGSTGRPKGAVNAHRGIVNRLLWMQDAYGLTPGDRVLQKTPFSFDVSVWEFFWPLTTGARLVMARPGGHQDPAYLAETILREGITTLHFVPPMLRAFLEQPGVEACAAVLRRVICSGEALPLDLQQRFFARLPGVELHNLYGPTEAAVDVTFWRCDPASPHATVPIGHPVANVSIHLLDPDLQPAATGELCIGGAQVGRGYLNRPDLTADRFIPDPFGGAGARLYRTGDLARHLPDGAVEFLGRIDHQVKIRGFRIELGEIEAALGEHPGVEGAVVVASDGPGGDRRLVAYLRSRGRTGTELVLDVKAGLRARLPEYMVPAVFVVLEEFPLSPNGKIDRKALPAPESRDAEREHVALRTAAEETLAGIWSEVFAAGRIGAADSFLELGGHSLLAVQVIARVRDRLGVELSLRDVFENPVLGALAARIEQGSGMLPGSPIMPVPRTGDLPLSFSQERVWFLQQLDPTIRSYQFQAKLRLMGGLHVEALRRSLAEIVRRHEILRTTFPTVEGRPVQRFHPDCHPARELPLPVIDLSGLAGGAREEETERAIRAECWRPFDVVRLPLIRWTLLRLGPGEHVLLHVEHHLAHDGWSFNRILEELATLYGAFSQGRPSPLPELPLQFADWAVWQREWMRGPQAAARIEAWKRTLSDRPAVLLLPTDRPRPRRQSFAGRVERVEMPVALCEALRAASRREGVSLYMLMEAAFAALLSRCCAQEQVNVGSAVANRRWRETESILGMIVDNVVLANDLSGDPTVRQLLQRTRRLTLEAAANQDIPFDLVVEAVQPERDPAYNPLFQVSFSFHDSPLSELVFPGLATELTEALSNGSAKFDMNVICIPRSEQRVGRAGTAEAGITLVWEYVTALFDRSTIQRTIGCFQTLLAGFAASPGSRVSELPLLTPEEESQLARWSGTEPVDHQGAFVHELFEGWADRAPEALAVAGLTYGKLETLSNRLAWRLRDLGVGPEVRVGVCLERSAHLVAAVLGVLKAGGAYLPLDPGHPAERLAYILEDAAVPVLITTLERSHFAGPARVVAIGGDLPERAERPRVPVHPESLAYVIYTSGSTGRPKGTELTHAGLLNLVGWHRREYGLVPADRSTLVASPAFDASVWEIWPPLASGASLHVPPEEVRASPPDLLAWLAAGGITVCFLPTPLAEACLEPDLPPGLALRALLTGGDRLHPVRRELPFRLINHYGPTESTVVSTAAEVAAGEEAPSIGRPIDNLGAWVLDGRLQRVPAGVPGELHVGGVGLARGYLRRPDLTAEKLVPSPFAEGERIYRTGDVVRWRPDGRIEFLGRADHQVKIRGIRIELGEIEAVLGRHPAVRAAVVVAREGPRLVGYAVPSETVAPDELRAFLAERLPAAMVPSAIVMIDSLPLTPNGKVDLAALPEPAAAEAGGGEWEEPRTPIEQVLQAIWSELIGVERIGIRDDFFKLGGHSLLGARIVSRVRDELEVDLPLSTMFDRRTIEGLAAAVEDLLIAEAERPAAALGEV
jgi:amino acid adenylation domain-containing protein